MRRPPPAAIVALALGLGGCAHTPPDEPSDPLESVNRRIYAFNDVADRFVLRPVAMAYDEALPDPAQAGIRNFLGNLFYPTVIVNDLLQLKLPEFGQDLARFVLNSTFGIAGLFDVADPAGLPARSEDFGQTLGHWRVGPGWFLMIPFLGPSNNRDLIGRFADGFTNPANYGEPVVAWGLGGLDLVRQRAAFLPTDRVIAQQLDPYVFVRTLYLQRRMDRVYDGNPPPEEMFGIEPEE